MVPRLMETRLQPYSSKTQGLLSPFCFIMLSKTQPSLTQHNAWYSFISSTVEFEWMRMKIMRQHRGELTDVRSFWFHHSMKHWNQLVFYEAVHWVTTSVGQRERHLHVCGTHWHHSLLFCMCAFPRSPLRWQSPVESLGGPCVSSTSPQHLLPSESSHSAFWTYFSFTASDVFSAPSWCIFWDSYPTSPFQRLPVCLGLLLHLSCIQIAMETGSSSSRFFFSYALIFSSTVFTFSRWGQCCFFCLIAWLSFTFGRLLVVY